MGGVWLEAVQCRKRPGNASGSTGAHRCATLSQVKIRIQPYKARAREGIQALRAAAHVFA